MSGPRPQKLQSGLAALHAGRMAEAERLLRQAVRQQPESAEALHCLGIALHAQGQSQQAAGYIERSLRLAPNSQAENNLALALLALGRAAEALAALDRALALRAEDAQLHYNRGNALMALQRNEEALAAFQRALSRDAGLLLARQNLGIVLTRLGRWDAALATYDALLATPLPGAKQAELRANRAGALGQLRRTSDALADCDAALAADPTLALAHFNASVVCLGMGDYERGWREWEWRWQAPEFWPHRPKWRQPTWLGQEDLAGRRILLDAEQGLGDTIQFCRYAPLVKARGAEVWLRAPAPLLKLLVTLQGVDRLLPMEELPQDFDFQTPLMSLPLAFGTRLDTVPAEVPYLAADPARVAHWAAVLGEKRGLRIGLAWSGNPLLKADAQRSAPLAALAPLFRDGIEVISVQRDLRPADAEAAARLGVRHFGEALRDFADTAAIVSLVDVVVSVDTAPAHLAGALGRPVWLMLHDVAEWRWMAERVDSPWYPTARLFRQRVSGDWKGVAEEIGRKIVLF